MCVCMCVNVCYVHAYVYVFTWICERGGGQKFVDLHEIMGLEILPMSCFSQLYI